MDEWTGLMATAGMTAVVGLALLRRGAPAGERDAPTVKGAEPPEPPLFVRSSHRPPWLTSVFMPPPDARPPETPDRDVPEDLPGGTVKGAELGEYDRCGAYHNVGAVAARIADYASQLNATSIEMHPVLARRLASRMRDERFYGVHQVWITHGEIGEYQVLFHRGPELGPLLLDFEERDETETRVGVPRAMEKAERA